jgi:hypothetical protein
MKDVHATGVTNTKAEKGPVTDEEEEQMWQAEVLGDKTAKTLLYIQFIFITENYLVCALKSIANWHIVNTGLD